MSGVVSALRFLIGLAMVAGGATLAGPTVMALAQQVARHGQGGAVVPQPAVNAGVAFPHWQPPLAAAGDVQPPPPSWPPVEADVAAAVVAAPDPHYQPPMPPAALPPLSPELAAGTPMVAAAYRSTLDVPPPPLLDAHRPPPLAVGWAAHDVAQHGPVAAMPDAVVPQSYVIRDGDDLTGIATRFYGHAAAATAIWAANQDLVPDPNVLPIGTALRLPPAWMVFGARGGGGLAIEPPTSAAPAAGVGATAAGRSSVATPVGWLGGGAPAAPAAAPQRPAAVRVAAGETLATLARRFYGDERMADRIWEANRDRLRSPQLVVAGMELQLP